MKLLLIQQIVGGPWTWCVLDRDKRIVAKAPQDDYKSAGQARAAARKILATMAGLSEAGKWSECPSVQLSLFPTDANEAGDVPWERGKPE